MLSNIQLFVYSTGGCPLKFTAKPPFLEFWLKGHIFKRVLVQEREREKEDVDQLMISHQIQRGLSRVSMKRTKDTKDVSKGGFQAYDNQLY